MERTPTSPGPGTVDPLRQVGQDRDATGGSSVVTPSRDELWNRALSAVGAGFGDGADVSSDHDRFLEKIFDE